MELTKDNVLKNYKRLKEANYTDKEAIELLAYDFNTNEKIIKEFLYAE